jgi:hypothetical protein
MTTAPVPQTPTRRGDRAFPAFLYGLLIVGVGLLFPGTITE